MEYGCIGEVLKHSFSKEIHNLIGDYPYQLKEIAKEHFEEFFKQKKFKGINVTIPYKEKVIPFLDYVDHSAKIVGAVNTIVNQNGKLYGYNTDFYGLIKLIENANVDINNKKVAILGSGGTSKTALAVAKELGAKDILIVSRSKLNGQISYEQLKTEHADVEVIINTTPCGMYPNNNECPIDVMQFNSLDGVIDVVYNPLSTNLVLNARAKGIKAQGGLYMLIAQAVKAYEIFFNTTCSTDKIKEIYNKILNKKQNVVLIGMPTCGKTTIGKLLSEKLGKTFIDTDQEIEKKGDKIADIFAKFGEQKFREVESQTIKKISQNTGCVIATGGGAVLKMENVKALKQNGFIVFLDRSLNQLLTSTDRPLSRTKDDVNKLYNQRYPIYASVCDVKVNADDTIEGVCNAVIKEILI